MTLLLSTAPIFCPLATRSPLLWSHWTIWSLYSFTPQKFLTCYSLCLECLSLPSTKWSHLFHLIQLPSLLQSFGPQVRLVCFSSIEEKHVSSICIYQVHTYVDISMHLCNSHRTVPYSHLFIYLPSPIDNKLLEGRAHILFALYV